MRNTGDAQGAAQFEAQFFYWPTGTRFAQIWATFEVDIGFRCNIRDWRQAIAGFQHRFYMFPPVDGQGKFEYQGRWLYNLAGHGTAGENHYGETKQNLDCLGKDTFLVYERAVFHVWHEFLRGEEKLVQEAQRMEVVSEGAGNLAHKDAHGNDEGDDEGDDEDDDEDGHDDEDVVTHVAAGLGLLDSGSEDGNDEGDDDSDYVDP